MAGVLMKSQPDEAKTTASEALRSVLDNFPSDHNAPDYRQFFEQTSEAHRKTECSVSLETHSFILTWISFQQTFEMSVTNTMKGFARTFLQRTNASRGNGIDYAD
jgi:hypothetical protein